MSEDKKINWAKIKAEYVTSEISLSKIAEKYGVSTSAINKKSSKESWSAEKKKQRVKAADKVAKKLNDKNVRKTVNDIERVCNAACKLISKINRAIDEIDKKEISVKIKSENDEREIEAASVEKEFEICKGLVDTKRISDLSKSLLNIKQVLVGSEKTTDVDKPIGIIELPTMQLLTPPEEEMFKNE